MVASRRPTGGERRQDVQHLLTIAAAGVPRVSGGALIAVVKSADLRDRHDVRARWRLDFARTRAVVVEGLMRAGGVVVREVPAQPTAEVPFVDHDDVIEAFPTNRADDALGEGILPGRPRRDKDLAYPQAFHRPYDTSP